MIPAHRTELDRTLGLLLIASAVIVNTAFLVLGSVFDYPAILQHPAEEVLARFGENPVVIGGSFALLALGAAMLAPVALLLSRRMGGGRLCRAASVVGVAAAAVQVIGLSRWPLVIPLLADAMATASPGAQADIAQQYAVITTVLGQIVGETLGYLLTATWTVLAVVLLRRSGMIGRPLAVLGLVSAGLIATGVLVPLHVPLTGLTNFGGYVLWSVWLIVLGIRLVRARSPRTAG